RWEKCSWPKIPLGPFWDDRFPGPITLTPGEISPLGPPRLSSFAFRRPPPPSAAGCLLPPSHLTPPPVIPPPLPPSRIARPPVAPREGLLLPLAVSGLSACVPAAAAGGGVDGGDGDVRPVAFCEDAVSPCTYFFAFSDGHATESLHEVLH
uniref:Uncharacterized protein n=1 Tax=Oryza rufipogon TaxID=4529 RepID=A0A0E0R4U8_ORYRU